MKFKTVLFAVLLISSALPVFAQAQYYPPPLTAVYAPNIATYTPPPPPPLQSRPAPIKIVIHGTDRQMVTGMNPIQPYMGQGIAVNQMPLQGQMPLSMSMPANGQMQMDSQQIIDQAMAVVQNILNNPQIASNLRNLGDLCGDPEMFADTNQLLGQVRGNIQGLMGSAGGQGINLNLGNTLGSNNPQAGLGNVNLNNLGGLMQSLQGSFGNMQNLLQ